MQSEKKVFNIFFYPELLYFKYRPDNISNSKM